MSRNGTRLKVLITIFVAASTANGETVQSTPSAVAVCQKIADRYRSLANAHPGEPPLIVLATTPATGVTIDHSPETLISSTEDLEAWGAKQDPPVVMDEVIKEVESWDQQAGGLYRIPASNYYSFSNVGSISGCIVAIYFTVSKGRAAPAAGPPRFAKSLDGTSCFVRRLYGVIDGVPAYFQEQYDASADMTSTLSVGTREHDHWIGPCHLTFNFSPIFTEHTAQQWNAACSRTDCASLHKDALNLVAAVQASPGKARRDALSGLNAPQLSEYRLAEKLARGALLPTDDPAKAAEPDPSSIMEQYNPLYLPYVHDGQVYIAGVGHLEFAEHPSADWMIRYFQVDQGKLVERASFAIGMERGSLIDIKISGSSPYSASNQPAGF